MKIATYNINGINGRLDILLRWLKQDGRDILCLPELICENNRFPEQELKRPAITLSGKARKAGTVWRSFLRQQ